MVLSNIPEEAVGRGPNRAGGLRMQWFLSREAGGPCHITWKEELGQSADQTPTVQ